jgi:hypothetical protein
VAGIAVANPYKKVELERNPRGVVGQIRPLGCKKTRHFRKRFNQLSAAEKLEVAQRLMKNARIETI